MKPKDKNFVHKIALERIHRLMELAEQSLRNKPEHSKNYVQLMKKISTKNKVRIPTEYKEKICKKCSSLLLEGVSASTRVKGTVLHKKCLKCGTVKKVFLAKKKKKLLVGLTGNIASGKTLVGKEFAEQGAELINADEVAKEVMNSNARVQAELKKVFGEKIFSNEKVDLKKLGEIVFSNYSKLGKLNSIVHPETKKELKKQAGKAKGRIVVLEVPLLFESGIKKMFGWIVWVDAGKEERSKRLKKKGFSEKQALQRINSQKQGNKKELSDFVIENNAGIKELREKAREIWGKILEEAK